MSIWHEVDGQDDIDFSSDGKDMHFLFDSDDCGNIYLSVPVEWIENALKRKPEAK